MLLLALMAPWAAKGQTTFTIGDGTSYSPTGTSSPSATSNGAGSPTGNTYFYNSTAQFIYTAEELGTAKTITSVAFNHNAQTLVGTLKIYLFHTTESTVNTSSYVTSGTPLYTGTNITLGGSSAGWQEFTLETPFEYNGTDNLLVVVCRIKRSDGQTPAYNTSLAWQYTSTSENYRYMMRSSDTESDVALSNTTKAYVQSYYRPNIQIGYELPSSCEKPDTFEHSNVTHNSATLTWSGGSGTYNVEVKGGEWADWTEILHETTLTTKNLEDLTMVTDYQARVQSVCTSENSGWKTTSFPTICGPIPVGYKCGFEGPNTVGSGSYKLPTCWSRPDGTSASYPGATNSYGHNSSSYSLYFYGTATSTLQIAVLPEIDGGVNGKRLALYARNPSYSYSASFVVGYMTDPADASTFVQVGDPISLTAPTSYGSEPYEFDFDNITGNPQYMAIKSTSTSSSSYFAIDDVELKTIPTCLRPTMLTTVTDKGATTATVSWTPNGTNQDHWDVYYCTSPYTAPTATTTPNVENTADNPCVLPGLTPSTAYRVYVRGNCGSGDVSEWSTNYCSFTTNAYCEDMQIAMGNITFSNVTYNSATINWPVVGGATQWKVQYNTTNDFTAATVVSEIVNENTLSISGTLEAEHTYYVRIAPYCAEASDFTPWSSPKNFSTPESCPAPVLAAATNPTAHGATLNWTGSSETYNVMAGQVTVNTLVDADFEDQTIPATWTNSTTYPWTITDADKHAGTYAIKSGGAGTAYAQSDLTLVIELTNAATISFWYKASSESDYDYGRFLINGTQKFQTSGTTNSWAQYTFDLTAGTNTLVWRYYKDSGTDKGDDCFYVDDITISSSTVGSFTTVATGITANTVVLNDDTHFDPETTYQVKVIGVCPWTSQETESNIVQFTTSSSCETPANVVSSEETASTAKISWDTHGLTTFNLRFKQKDATDWNTTIEGITCPYTITTNLKPNTEYLVQVQGICTSGNTEWSVSGNFITDCGPISVATEAYQYDFETTLKWNCWTVPTGSGSSAIDNSSSNAHNSNKYLRFTGSYRNIVILPEFEEATSTLQLNYWTRPENISNSNCGTFDVGYVTSLTDTSTFVKIERYKYNDWETSAYLEKTIYFDGVPDNAYIAFRHNANATNYWWYVDDIEVSVAPLCRPVKNLAYNNVTNHSATITWKKGTEDQDAWQLKYNKTNDFDPDSEGTLIDNISDTTYTFNKTLDAVSVYYIYVRANCGGSNGNSPWTKTVISTGAASPAPTAFNKKEVGPDWVDLYWTAPAGDYLSGYGIYYQDAATPAPTAETPATVTIDNPTAPTSENPYRLPNLENEHTYYIWVRANHETNVYSAWTQLASPYYITTLVACPTPTTLAANNITHNTADLTWTGYSDSYTVEYQTSAYQQTVFFDDFENGIGDWTVVTEDEGPGWEISSDDYYSSSHSMLAYSYNYYSYTAYDADNWLISPQITMGKTLKFFAIQDYSDQYTVLFSSTNDISSFTTVLKAKATAPSTWTEVTVDLSSVEGQTGYIAIHHEKYDGGYLAIDDFGIYGDEVPAGGWEVATTTATNGEYPLEGLTQNTQYDVRVKGNCGGEYSDVYSFKTYSLFTKNIAGYGTSDGGYYLIASPVTNDITPTGGTGGNGFITANYDLYYFNPAGDSDGKEWINFKDANDGNFNLANGKGYLYASKTNTTLNFIGTPYSGNGQVALVFASSNTDETVNGYNLIGNPFATPATVDKPYYRLNNTGDALKTETESTAVNAMEGVFVQVTAAGTATFTPQTSKAGQQAIAKANIMVNDYKGKMLDNAIIRFDGGETLGKFSFRDGSTKVYIPQDGKDYAIVNAGNVGEMPLNFKAEKNGAYTLSFTAEEVGFSYLHLIDNLTGNDVDLLANPSYTFNAKMTDYATRFRLVFATGSSVEGDNFGFINGSGNLCIFGIEGTATLQVIDVTGRILSSETFSGSYEKQLNAAPGVYVMRLINNGDVKTQKIVVR